MAFRPVGAPGMSVIGQSLSRAIDSTSDALARERERKRLEREQGIVPLSEIGTTTSVVRDRSRPAPVAQPLPAGPIASAAIDPQVELPVQEIQSDLHQAGVPQPLPQIAQPVAPVVAPRMAGPMTIRESVNQGGVDIGGGMAYVPGLDREAVIGGHRANATARGQRAAQQEMFMRLAPMADRVRSGTASGADLMALSLAGVKPADLMDPKSEFNTKVAQIVAETTAREQARAPFLESRRAADDESWRARQDISHGNYLTRIQAQEAARATRPLTPAQQASAERARATDERRAANEQRQQNQRRAAGRAAEVARAVIARDPSGNDLLRVGSIRVALRALNRREGMGLTEEEIQGLAVAEYRKAVTADNARATRERTEARTARSGASPLETFRNTLPDR
jgi:hypothetical protein